MFWAHLYKADLLAGITGKALLNGVVPAWNITHPAAKSGGGFIAGYADGNPFPYSPKSTGMKGVILVLSTSPTGNNQPDIAGAQAISPTRAAQIDRKMDDGMPTTGKVQAYGAPECYVEDKDTGLVKYNEDITRKSCNLIFNITPTN